MPRRRLSERGIAASEGRLTYHSTPCRHGHDSARYTRNGTCIACARAKALAYKRKIARRLEQALEEKRTR